jgi:hypothetical protein
MLIWEQHIPAYLTKKSNITRHVMFTAVFALVFINMYAPFGVTTWYNVTQTQLFFYSSLVILTGVLLIVLSRIMLYLWSKYQRIKYGLYTIWITAEILSMALVYTLLMKLVVNDSRDFFTSFKAALTITLAVLLIPYAVSWLYFSWKEKNKKIEELEGQANPKTPASVLIPFTDEKGELRFSLKTNDLLYLEAADNYVVIHYLDHTRRARYVLRNSLRTMEQVLKDHQVIRCHRSYMVNFERIKMIRKEKDGLVLDLDFPEKLTLPVSKTYVDQIIRTFSGYTSLD